MTDEIDEIYNRLRELEDWVRELNDKIVDLQLEIGKINSTIRELKNSQY